MFELKQWPMLYKSDDRGAKQEVRSVTPSASYHNYVIPGLVVSINGLKMERKSAMEAVESVFDLAVNVSEELSF